MDNVCHTLVGAAIGESGGRRWTPLATATLLIGANLPDVDVAAYAWGPVTALGFRRGWTHGVLALALWPLVLTGVMLAWDRLVRRRRRPDAPPARPRAVLVLALLAVWSHPLLDYLNVYGVRLLMPFSERWFYGDALFIVDPWVWAALALAMAAARLRVLRGWPVEPWAPRLALGLVAAYSVAMLISGRRVEQAIARAMAPRSLETSRTMVAPDPVSPFTRTVVLTLPDGYLIGHWDFRASPRLRGAWTSLPSGSAAPAARLAARTPRGRTFLRWARFPFFELAGRDGCPATAVCLRDARYFAQAWAEVAIPRESPLSSGAPPAQPRSP